MNELQADRYAKLVAMTACRTSVVLGTVSKVKDNREFAPYNPLHLEQTERRRKIRKYGIDLPPRDLEQAVPGTGSA